MGFLIKENHDFFDFFMKIKKREYWLFLLTSVSCEADLHHT